MPSLTLLKNQGFSNTNYLLKTFKKNYIIRVFGSAHVNRKKEFKIAQKAYAINIGAKPIYQNDCLMISEHIKGSHKFVLKYSDIKAVALLLQKLHRTYRIKKDFVLCHRDLNPKNFIFSKDVKLIDWEYADYDNRYFDLASFLVEFDLNKKEENLFLKTYFKNYYLCDKKKLYSYKRKYIQICLQWFQKQNNQKELLKFQKRLKNL